MPTKKNVKKYSENIIEQQLGVRLYKLQGELDCEVAPHVRTSWNGKQYMVGHIAVCLLTDMPPSEITRVAQTCGIKNCVAHHHLVVNGEPLVEYKDEEKGVFKAKLDIDKPDYFGNIHDVPEEMWAKMTEEEKQRAREGKFDVAREGFGISARPIAS